MTEQSHPTASCGLCTLLGAVCLAVLLCGCSGSPPPNSRAGTRFDGNAVKSEVPRDQPPSAKTLYSMADILATQGKDTECEFVLRRCLQEHPRFTPAYNSLAELQMRQGRVREAVEVLSRALQIRPRDPVLLNNLGMCLLIREEYDMALAHFTKAATRSHWPCCNRSFPRAKRSTMRNFSARHMTGMPSRLRALLRFERLCSPWRVGSCSTTLASCPARRPGRPGAVLS